MSLDILIRPKSFTLRDTLHYYTASYFTPKCNRLGVITQSTTVGNKKYHLVDVQLTHSSYLATALKVISYFTLILPTLAFLISKLTKSADIYYSQNEEKIMLQNYFLPKASSQETAAAIIALNTLGLMSKQFPLSNNHTLLEEAINSGRYLLATKIFQTDSTIFLTHKDSLVAQDFCTKFFSGRLIGESEGVNVQQIADLLVRGTEGNCLKGLPQTALRTIFFNVLQDPNYHAAYRSLASQPFLPSSVLNQFSLDDLWSNQKPHENATYLFWKDLYALNPNMLRTVENEETLFSKAIRHGNAQEFIDFVCNKDPQSIILRPNVRAIINSLLRPSFTDKDNKNLATFESLIKASHNTLLDHIEDHHFIAFLSAIQSSYITNNNTRQQLHSIGALWVQYMVSSQKTIQIPVSLFEYFFYQQPKGSSSTNISWKDLCKLDPTLFRRNLNFVNTTVRTASINGLQALFLAILKTDPDVFLEEAVARPIWVQLEKPTTSVTPNPMIQPTNRMNSLFACIWNATQGRMENRMMHYTLNQLSKNNKPMYQFLIDGSYYDTHNMKQLTNQYKLKKK